MAGKDVYKGLDTLARSPISPVEPSGKPNGCGALIIVIALIAILAGYGAIKGDGNSSETGSEANKAGSQDMGVGGTTTTVEVESTQAAPSTQTIIVDPDRIAGCVLVDPIFRMAFGGIKPGDSGYQSALISGAECADGSSSNNQSSPQQVDAVQQQQYSEPAAVQQDGTQVTEIQSGGYRVVVRSEQDYKTTGIKCDVYDSSGNFVSNLGPGGNINGAACPRLSDADIRKRKKRSRKRFADSPEPNDSSNTLYTFKCAPGAKERLYEKLAAMRLEPAA